MEDGVSIVMAYHNRRSQLIKTLESIDKSNYDKTKLQIIIVNDNSFEEHSINDLKMDFEILIINIKEKQKQWINSCIPYNIGFNHIKYDKVILQNPECYHNGDVISDVNQRLNNETYISYGCYSLTPQNSKKEDFKDVNILEKECISPLGDGWYNHSVYRQVYFHFCAALTYESLAKLNGFDERYKDGIGFDDNEIILRIRNMDLELKIIDKPHVFHQAHESVFHYNKSTTEEDKKKKLDLYYKNKYIFDNMTKCENKYHMGSNVYFNIKNPIS